MSKGATRRGAKNSKGRYHPTRTSGIQKQMRARVVNEMAKKVGRRKRKPEVIDTGNPDWSIPRKRRGR